MALLAAAVAAIVGATASGLAAVVYTTAAGFATARGLAAPTGSLTGLAAGEQTTMPFRAAAIVSTATAGLTAVVNTTAAGFAAAAGFATTAWLVAASAQQAKERIRVRRAAQHDCDA